MTERLYHFPAMSDEIVKQNANRLETFSQVEAIDQERWHRSP